MSRAGFVPGFEPLVVTESGEGSSSRSSEDDDESTTTERETEPDSGDRDEDESDTSSTEKCTLPETSTPSRGSDGAPFTVKTVPLQGAPDDEDQAMTTKKPKPHPLQKMSSFDFKKQQKEMLEQHETASAALPMDMDAASETRRPSLTSASQTLPSPRSKILLTTGSLPPIPNADASQQRRPPQMPSTQSVRTQVGSSKLRSAARTQSCDRKKLSRSKYASSLPDRERRQASPFDVNGLLASDYLASHLDRRSEGRETEQRRSEGPELFRGHPLPTKYCRNKHLWARTSLEREVFTGKASSPGPAPTNRHSSYHPSLVEDAAAAAAAHVAHQFNHYFSRSRPTSPQMFDSGLTGRHCDSFSKGSSSCVCHCCNCHCRSVGLGAPSGSRGSLLGLDYEDRLLRLESDKDSLHLQVSVLSDQIDAQTSKIHDLEKCLDDKKNVLESTEDTLQRELLTRSSLETQKLELMTEISSLRLKQAALERENFDLKDRWGGAGRSSVDLHYGGDPRLWEKPPLAHLLRPSSPALSQQPNGIDSGSLQRNRLGNNGTEGSPPKPTRPRTPPANAYRRVEQSAFGTIPRRNPSSQLSAFNNGLCTEGSNGNGTSYSSGNLQAVPYQQQNNGSYIPTAKHPVPFPVQPKSFLGQQELLGSSSGGGGQLGVGGGGGLFFLTDPNSGPRSTSAPNLAAIEREEWERRNNSSNGKTKSPGSGGHKSRGILRILSKLKRSNSGGLENEVAPESLAPFARGGLRSTAAPRLGWLQEPKVLKRPEGPVSSWDCASVILWLDFLGLSMYSTEVKRWVKSGQQLLDASTKELEKELNIKNSLHRKKLSLALYSLKHPEEEDNAGRLDYHWVIRWLDDVGLPQYKETFSEARVDGRVLSALTSDDLILLKVTSQLHHTSIKRGIQLLRIHKFQPSCLCRRGGPAPGTAMINGDGASRGPRHVATWTNHRVMEWLRAIDLSEYAPNLRGSGVHGAVMILEPKFNAELLATFLSIPANKTLLRRHLSLQVNEVVGRHIVHEKRTVELASDFIPISPTTKVKPTKPAKVFNLRKKRQSSDMNEDLLCPLDWNSFPFPNEAHTENLDMPLDRGNNRSDPVSNI